LADTLWYRPARPSWRIASPGRNAAGFDSIERALVASGLLRRLIRRFGYDLIRYPAKASPWPKLATLLQSQGVTLVFDVGANTGQYALRLREYGYAGRIVSHEPQSAAHAALTQVAAGDTAWEIAPRAAVGAKRGETTINLSADSDMSSVLPMTDEAQRLFESTRTIGTERVAVVTLADEIVQRAGPTERVFVKSDTQGFEAQVLDGCGAAIERVVGLQLELSLLPIYRGQPRYLEMLARIEALGFTPRLLIPGYWSRHHGRMLEFDVVAFR
jgi:FkbM family methyltransferase